MTPSQKRAATRAANKAKNTAESQAAEDAAKAGTAASSSSGSGTGESGPSKSNGGNSNVIDLSGISKPPFDTSLFKYDPGVAYKVLSDSEFPKLSGPTNFVGWLQAFKRAMVWSGFWGFFNETFDDAFGTVWYNVGSEQAIELLKHRCNDSKALEIDTETIPSVALATLTKNSKAVGISRYQALQQEWADSSMKTCGSAKEFKAVLLKINRQLLQIDPAFVKPPWEINSHFIRNLTNAYEHKVSALSSRREVISPVGTMSFDELSLEIIEEEARLLARHGDPSDTVAVTKASKSATSSEANGSAEAILAQIRDFEEKKRS